MSCVLLSEETTGTQREKIYLYIYFFCFHGGPTWKLILWNIVHCLHRWRTYFPSNVLNNILMKLVVCPLIQTFNAYLSKVTADSSWLEPGIFSYNSWNGGLFKHRILWKTRFGVNVVLYWHFIMQVMNIMSVLSKIMVLSCICNFCAV